MASTELGRKMRDTLEATLPDAELAVRRVARQRALRLAEGNTNRRKALASRWLPDMTAWKSVAVGGALVAALLTLGLVYGPWWPEDQIESVTVEPSLERDLELLPRAPRAAEPTETMNADVRRAIDGAEDAPAAAPSAARPLEKSLPAGRTPAAVAPASASRDTDARWVRVSDAMRKGDWEAAKVALAPLSASSDPETKDSARLLRIRIELSNSQNQTLEPRWRAELSELASSGSTSSIRASARRLLEGQGSAPNLEEEPSP